VRRSWTLEQKRRVVAECGAEGASIAGVARRHGLNANQLYAWRRRLDGEGAGVRHGVILPVTLAAVEQMEAGPVPPVAPPVAPSIAAPTRGRIQILLPGGVRIIVGADVEGAALQRVLRALGALGAP
jgi:transposase